MGLADPSVHGSLCSGGLYYHRDQLPLFVDTVLVEGEDKARHLDRFRCLLSKSTNLASLVEDPLQHSQFVRLNGIEHMNVPC